ncbi:MAG: hypothetical protein ACRC41_14510 [Sarcina sp.]
MNKKILIGIIALVIGVTTISCTNNSNDRNTNSVNDKITISNNDKQDKAEDDLNVVTLGKEDMTEKSKDNMASLKELGTKYNMEEEIFSGDIGVDFMNFKDGNIEYKTSYVGGVKSDKGTGNGMIAVHLNFTDEAKENKDFTVDLNKGFIKEATEILMGEKVNLTKISEKITEKAKKGSNASKTKIEQKVGQNLIEIQESTNGNFAYIIRLN